MLSRKADGPLEVQIPRPADDQPSWTRVGVIAAIGFIVGIYAGARFQKATIWLSIATMALTSLWRGFAPPLSISAIAAVSILHVAIGCLSVVLLKFTKPAGSA